jgi:very-short-patch-repair endonuclease
MALNDSKKMLEVTVRYAQRLRKKPTKTEILLWEQLRTKKLGGWRFQRQRPILIELHGLGTFAVADFYCGVAKLIVEVDGSVHEDQEADDRARDEALARRGFGVLRISASDVQQNMAQVLKRIDAAACLRIQKTKAKIQ